MNRAVLGSGLAGLITGYLLGWPVIGENIGGQAKAPFPLGPRILEVDKYSSLLLRLLDIKKEPRVFKVGYIYSKHSGEMPRVHPTAAEGFREAYYYKTRGYSSPTTSSMSEGKETIVGWDIEDINLLNLLSYKVPVKKGTITSILLKEPNELVLSRRTKDGLRYAETLHIEPRNLINTLPLPTFLDLSRVEWSSERPIAGDVRFLRIRATDSHQIPWFEGINKDYDYAYIAAEDIPIHRVTRLPGHPLQFIGELNDLRYAELKELSEFRPRILDPNKGLAGGVEESLFRIIESCLIKGSQILNPHPTGYSFIRSIRMIGRYAKWDHSIKLNHVIREAMELAEQMGRSFER